MEYISTRGKSLGGYSEKVSAAEAIKMGLAPDGGLFVPETIPKLSLEEIEEMKGKSYQIIAKQILKLFLTDYTEKEIEECISLAYNQFNFESNDIAPLVKLDENNFVMELWHGPTAAFKDMALQIMPQFLSRAMKKIKSPKETVILVATSGDTGKAALEGYKDVDGIQIIVFYPAGGVSKVQELQMLTTNGSNTYVVGVNGNFDDCQTAVKNIFTDKEFNEYLSSKNYEFSSANSINWGRLLPQIIYYFSSYIKMVDNKEIVLGERVNYCVPTGNFGNILAAYYAKEMGLPINKLICASNVNNVLTEFFRMGSYNKDRTFFKTVSPSMDILISSNLERFLFEITGHDSKKISQWYEKMKKTGSFEIDKETKEKIDKIISAGYATEEKTLKTIENAYKDYDYVMDTHTAVALKVALETKVEGKTIIDSTASPYKFTESVIKGLRGKEITNEFDAIEELNKMTGLKVHRAIEGLNEKQISHKYLVEKTQIKNIVKEILKI